MANPNSIAYSYYQDIQIPDISLQQQFNQYMADGQFVNALQLLQNNQQLNSKAYVAQIINKMINGIMTLQNLYFNGVPLFLTNLANTYFDMINAWKNCGVWDSTIQYDPGNFVVYDNQIYYCFNTSVAGTLPTNESYWVLLGLRGNPGEPGMDVNMRFQWNENNPYQLNDLVVYKNTIYVAIQPNTNQPPDVSPDSWIVFLAIGRAEIYVSENAPANPEEQAIWFKTEGSLSGVTEVLGQFQIYHSNSNSWEAMYPNVLFSWSLDLGTFKKMPISIPITINTGYWSGNTWTYSDSRITDNTLIEVWPADLNTQQQQLFNILTMNISNGAIQFNKTSGVPVVPLNIIIKLYN